MEGRERLESWRRHRWKDARGSRVEEDTDGRKTQRQELKKKQRYGHEPNKKEVTREWRKLHNEVLNNLNSSNIFRVIK